MRCSNCGTPNAPDRKYCATCGMRLESDYVRMVPARKQKSNKWIWIVIVVIIIVAVVIVPIILYMMVLGFSGSSGNSLTPHATLLIQPTQGGAKATLVGITSVDVLWDDVTIQFEDEDRVSDVSWSPSGPEWTAEYGDDRYVGEHELLGTMEVWLNITNTGSGPYLTNNDYMLITRDDAHQSDTTTMFWLTLIYEPTAEQMCSFGFHF